ncbi:PREDICTED: uncharacterized protein LOC108780063 [Cyphomyrmex costatus]|uniref:Receptor ligand binding region domain-containing protein n=1 Tax=Cyphomyrmex costatus TaxID=456900 RepID=A0A151I9J8_9HYME|nr:PREDICTED: uncharacterized protein LOC108780063 [Cyphomyrmex costatus]KYM95746.1 hypothetical protein ALC62_13563 [Cyphomyrmex costatus]
MGVSRTWYVILVVIAACTCGARTECGETVQISFLTSVHDDPSCTKLSPKGVTLYEAAKLLAEIHNNKTDGFEIEITIVDTCGSITGALKAVMKALVWADVNCLHPPYHLGIIGPDTMTNIEVVHKVTSILKVPHIIKKPSISPYLHFLTDESNSYLVEAILKITEILKWKSFTLVTKVDDKNDDHVQNITKKLTVNAIANNLCVIVHDNNKKDYTSHIVHIGKPKEKFFNELKNATILIVSEGNLKDYLNQINSTNTILLLEDSRNVINGLEWRTENSQWWAPDNGLGKYDAEELKRVRWLENAIKIYVKALNALCKNKKCNNEINPLDWNHMVSNMLMIHNKELEETSKFLNLSMKKKTSNLERLGDIVFHQNKTKIYWDKNKINGKEKDIMQKSGKNHGASRSNDNMSYMFRELIKEENESISGCVTGVKEIKMQEKNNNATQVLVSGMNHNEWWTMVCTVSGVGIAMFLVGIFAVYVIYTNIRGPKCAKNKNHLGRDTSLRRMSNDKELPTTITTHNQRMLRTSQRRDSNSTISEKSI